tara:strand:+ start:2964 stop:3191 length:228 start_codon:yes stop_codon:yes gene_type:complete
MKTPEEIKEIKSKLNTSEISDINWLHAELETFLSTDEVSIQGVTTLENMINTLNNFRRTYTQRVIRLMKSGHIVD